jgi:diguanylate cyclase (GGDEF)-like protein
MAVDPHTMLLLTNGIAFVSAAFLLLEWRASGERFLARFALGFLAIVMGCSLAPLRESGWVMLGIWLSNSMLPLAHWFFLDGVAALAGRKLQRRWLLAPIVCSGLMALIEAGAEPVSRDPMMSLVNAAVVAVLSLKAASVLLAARRPGASDTAMLTLTFLVHGGFYAVKAACAFVPGAFVDLSRYTGAMIPISLFEGVLVAVALAMSIAGALRRRREDHAIHLAHTDPLTTLLNRRGFEQRARAVLEAAAGASGALLLIDVDHFKTVNDRFGHQQGDRLLVALATFLQARTPTGAVTARLGGDEFAVLLPQVDEHTALRFARSLCADFVAPGPFGEGVLEPARDAEGSGTLSIGCALFASDAATLSHLYSIADRGLYEAKRKGRNRTSLMRTGDAPDRDPGATALPPIAAAIAAPFTAAAR